MGGCTVLQHAVTTRVISTRVCCSNSGCPWLVLDLLQGFAGLPLSPFLSWPALPLTCPLLLLPASQRPFQDLPNGDRGTDSPKASHSAQTARNTGYPITDRYTATKLRALDPEHNCCHTSPCTTKVPFFYQHCCFTCNTEANNNAGDTANQLHPPR
ncbi:uncharacterized protein LOC144753077 [Lissotriton helveticus]